MEKLWKLVLFVLILSYKQKFITQALIGPNVKIATPKQFEFMVSLVSKKERECDTNPVGHFCAGALISRRHILTAAHCLVGDEKDINVIVGSHDLKYGKKYRIKSAITYIEWAEDNNVALDSTDHDIAVIKLSKCVNSKIGKAKISNGTNRDFYNLTAVTAGWGMTNNNKLSIDNLLTATFQVMTHADCEANVKATSGDDAYVPRRLLCTQANPHILLGCADSGGPLIINDDEIIGINESVCDEGDTVDPRKTQNIHVGVDHYRKFINDVVDDKSIGCFGTKS